MQRVKILHLIKLCFVVCIRYIQAKILRYIPSKYKKSLFTYFYWRKNKRTKGLSWLVRKKRVFGFSLQKHSFFQEKSSALCSQVARTLTRLSSCGGFSHRLQSIVKKISGRRGSNPRRQPWEGCILPLNYVRLSFSI